jgi:hypothetical protein
METGSPSEDLSKSKVEVENGAPTALETLIVLVLARRRLLRHSLLLRVILRTLEESPVLARRRLLHHGLFLRILLRTSEWRSESGTELLRTMCGSRTSGWSLPGVMSD